MKSKVRRLAVWVVILCVYTIVFAADDQAEIAEIRTKVEQAGEIKLDMDIGRDFFRGNRLKKHRDFLTLAQR